MRRAPRIGRTSEIGPKHYGSLDHGTYRRSLLVRILRMCNEGIGAVLMDLLMPVVAGGTEATRQIEQASPNRRPSAERAAPVPSSPPRFWRSTQRVI